MIAVERRDLVTLLRIERHAQRNALDLAHASDLLAALADAPPDTRCFVLTGEEPHHSYGVDLVGQTYELEL